MATRFRAGQVPVGAVHGSKTSIDGIDAIARTCTSAVCGGGVETHIDHGKQEARGIASLLNNWDSAKGYAGSYPSTIFKEAA